MLVFYIPCMLISDDLYDEKRFKLPLEGDLNLSYFMPQLVNPMNKVCDIRNGVWNWLPHRS
jgi:hypothetical protein